MSLPLVKILEEPAAKALRFRYECEGRSAGSLPGATSTHEKKTFPKIQVISSHHSPPLTKGVVVVSCVTVEPPHRPHPHNLVGKEGCKKGVCTMELSLSQETNEMVTEFSNLGIQCVKKKDIEESLRVREEIRVDPFRTGFTHKTQPGSIDLNALRLCFQVFLEGPERGQFKIPLKPVVSEAIYDKKAINDLTIMKLSECTSPVLGNKEIIMLCDKVSKDDIEIRFYETTPTSPHTTVWEAFADFQPSDVHKQYAITFRTPAYRDLEITTPTTSTYIQLRCPSKDTTSLPRMFEFTPIASGIHWQKSIYTKKRKINLEEAIDSEDYGLLGDVLQEPISAQDETEGVYDLDLELVRQLAIGGVEFSEPIGSSGGRGFDFERDEREEVIGGEFRNEPMDTSPDVEAPPPQPPPRPPKSPLPPLTSQPPPTLPPKKVVKNKNFFKSLFSKSPKKVVTGGNVGSHDNGLVQPTDSEQLLDDLDQILAIESVEQFALYDHNVPKATLSECDDFSLRGRNNN